MTEKPTDLPEKWREEYRIFDDMATRHQPPRYELVHESAKSAAHAYRTCSEELAAALSAQGALQATNSASEGGSLNGPSRLGASPEQRIQGAKSDAEAPQGWQPIDGDARKFLELLLTECGTGPSDHEWRKCRRCLALHQLEGHQPLARRMIERAIERMPLPPACNGG